MSDIIQLLPDTVANQIAAGEVIQRPASVIKELVENAVDAGAKRIDVSVVDAGRTSIQVIDDGCGMSETDARLAFERHATSKIRQANDLFNLHTMGFRGEALPSIAAVAQVELKTKQQGEDIGTDLCMAGSKVVSQEACACPAGSNFMVENLFERIVLVYPNITFTFHSNGTELYDLRACGLRQRIVDVFGKRINQDLLPVKVETSVCRISGFVGKPESAKKKGARQFFFVNGRFMRHPYFSKAVMTVYERLVPQGEQVPYFLYFDVDPKDIDVNIHPTKTEIKFENEQAIWQILFAAVRDAVGSFNDVSTIDFDVEYTQGAQFDMPKVDYNPNYNPFKETSGSGSLGGSTMHQSKLGQDYMDKPVSPKVPDQWDTLYSGLDTQPSPDHTMLFPETPSSDEGLIEEKSPVHYQYKGRFIMTAVKSGLMIIDQHRAHVRILFEDYLRRLKARQMHSQKVLFPQSVDFSAQEIVTLSRLKDDITQLGFELTSLGGNTFSINAIPEGFEGIDIPALLHDILSETAEEQSSAIEQVHESLALSLARAAAIPYGEVLNNDEMEKVINGLFQCENVNYTPDGKATLCILKQRDIEQMLG